MQRLVTILYCFVALVLGASAADALYSIDTVEIERYDSLTVNRTDSLDEWNLSTPFAEESDTIAVPDTVCVEDSLGIPEDTLEIVEAYDEQPVAHYSDNDSVKTRQKAASNVKHRSSSDTKTRSVATKPKPVAMEQKPVAVEPEPAEVKETDTASGDSAATVQAAVRVASIDKTDPKDNNSNHSDYTMTIPIWLFCLIAVVIIALVALVVFYARKVSNLRERVTELKGEVMYLNNMRNVKSELGRSEQVGEIPSQSVGVTALEEKNAEPQALTAEPAKGEPAVVTTSAATEATPVAETEPAAKISFAVPSKPVVASVNDKQVQQLVKNIEKHISEPELGVEQLAMSMDMSRSQLYNLCNEVLGQTPAAFILDIRLKRAMQLIETRQFKMNEVSTQVGFVDAKYFAKVFKKKVGMTPSQYLDSIVNQ